MDSLGRTPARTEADICAALAELGGQAPSADSVLSELREARSRRQRRSPWLPGQPLPAGPGRALIPQLGWPQLAVGAAAMVTATAVTLTLTLGGSPNRTGGPDVFPALPNSPASADGPPAVVSPGHDPTSASLARAMLTAFNAGADDLAYETVADFTAGHLTQTDRTWSWPAVPSPGQLQYMRDASSAIPRGASETTAPVKLTEDTGYTTVVPRPSIYLQKEHARVIVVCYVGFGTGCGWGPFDTPSGTWSQHTAVMPYVDSTPSPGGADLARQIARGQWRIVGHTRLRGQRAIKLTQTRSGTFQGHPVFLWVSTSTYLPLRMIWGARKFPEVDNWYYLPPSKANLAHLRVPIPPGYPRSG
jgi:hypothetical protein